MPPLEAINRIIFCYLIYVIRGKQETDGDQKTS